MKNLTAWTGTITAPNQIEKNLSGTGISCKEIELSCWKGGKESKNNYEKK